MRHTLAAAALCLLAAGCAFTTPAAVNAETTLGSIAAQQNKSVATLVTDGQLFCANPLTGIALAVVTADFKPTSVIGKGSDIVAAACPILAGVQTAPVSPPSAPATAPVVVSPAAAALPAAS